MNVYLGSTEVGSSLGSTGIDGIYLGENEILSGKPEIVTIAYTEWGNSKIEWDKKNNQFILTNNNGEKIAIADTDYGLPPFKELGIADIPGYSTKIEYGLYDAMMKYGPLAYVPGWDTGLTKINDMHTGDSYHEINLTHTLKDWSDIGKQSLTTSDCEFIQNMGFMQINIWRDASGNNFQQGTDLMMCLNIFPQTYAIELNGHPINGEPVRSTKVMDNSTVYIPGDYFSNGNTMLVIQGSNAMLRRISTDINEYIYNLSHPGRIRLRGKIV